MPPPPGSWGSGPAGRPYGPTRRIAGLAKAINALQVASIVGTLVILVLQIQLSGDAHDYVDGVITESAFKDAVSPFVSISLLVGVVAIASLVVSIIWSFRIAANLEQLGRGPVTWKPGLTIVVWLLGSCTLSIINLLMLKEHWRKSDPEATHDPWGNAPRPRVSPLVIAWFVVNLAQVVANVARVSVRSGIFIGGGNLESTKDMAESLSDRLGLAIVATSLSAAATALLLLVVRGLTARHVQLTGEA